MNRDEFLARLADRRERWDVIAIGGGATGLGAALDATTRGYKTLLLERGDFACATSSRSTKLIHGGIRYLRQGNIGLVRESLRERGLLLQNAPHLVRLLAFVVPDYSWRDVLFYNVGLKFYDLLAGAHSLSLPRHLSREETLVRLPTLNADGLRGAELYHDAQFDDARLAITLAQTVADYDGVPLNYVRVVEFLKCAGCVCGVRARDEESGAEYELQARVVINATGVFSDELRRLDDAAATPMLAPSQGAHLVLDRAFLSGDSALMIPRTSDGRVLFAIPWRERVLIGTTDTPVREIASEPRPFKDEIEFLLAHAAKYLTRVPRHSDILSAFAGLRPLVRQVKTARTSKLARDHTITISASGLVTIAGGKWTTFRKMGEDVVNAAAEVGSLEKRESRTWNLHLHGWSEESLDVYGSDKTAVDALAKSDASLSNALHEKLDVRGCEVVWAVRRAMALTVADVLARRTRALFLDARASMEIAPLVAQLMAAELRRGEEWQRTQTKEFCKLAQSYLA